MPDNKRPNQIVNEGPVWVKGKQPWVPPGPTSVLFVQGGVRLEVQIGDGPAIITSGYASGHKEVERPENRPITPWDKSETVKMDVPLLLDGYAQNIDQQPKLNRVLALGRVDGGATEPEPFRMWSRHLPVKGGLKWVMESTPDFGDTLRNKHGKLVRQWMTLHLMRYTNPDQVKITRVKRKKKKFETVRKGETVNKLAARIYKGKSRRYVQVMAARIAKLNKIRDRNQKLKVGRKLKMPTNTTVKKSDEGKKK